MFQESLFKRIVFTLICFAWTISALSQPLKQVVSIELGLFENNSILATDYIILQPGFSVDANTDPTKAYTYAVAALSCITAPVEDITKSWSKEISYDLNGNIVSETIIYKDLFGKEIQSQTKNIQEKKIFVTEIIYDNLGKSVISTLPAPSLYCDFAYIPNFTQNISGVKYSPADFDKNITASNLSGEIYNPVQVGKNDGTLGWYYGLKNSIEPGTPAVDYPYFRSFSLFPEVTISSGPDLATNFKSGIQNIVASFPVHNELDHYASRSSFYSTNARTLPADLYQKGFRKAISKDANGIEKVIFYDPYGKIVATADVSTSVPSTATGSMDTPLKDNPLSLRNTILITTKYGTRPVPPGFVTYTYAETKSCPVLTANDPNQTIKVNISLTHPATGESIVTTNELNYTSIKDFNDNSCAQIFNYYLASVGEYNVEISASSMFSTFELSLGAQVSKPSLNTSMHNKLFKSSSPNAPGYNGEYVNIGDGTSTFLSISKFSDIIFVPSISSQKFRIVGGLTPTETSEWHFPRNGICEVAGSTEDNVFVSDNTCYQQYPNQYIKITWIGSQYGFLRVESKQPFGVKYKVGTISPLIPFATSTISVKPLLPTYQYIHLTQITKPYLIAPGTNTLFTDMQTGKSYSKATLPNVSSAYYLVRNTNNSPVEVSYTSSYTHFTYYYYDEAGQLVATVPPLYTVPGKEKAITNTYAYNSSGNVISKYTPDEGISEFVFRKDGQLRFSKNSKQQSVTNGTTTISGANLSKTFSYRNYDRFGRTIQLGEYQGTIAAAGLYYLFTPEDIASFTATGTYRSTTDIIESLADDVSNNPDVPRCAEVNEIAYTSTEATSPMLTRGANIYKQNNIAGGVLYTKNQNSQTWCSYDLYGRMAWSVQNIVGLDYKTLDYTYDQATGNLTKVAYQKGETDQFYTYYTYDKNQKIIKVETSLNDASKQVEAVYKYYLHGPVKRKEIAGNAQGIDYLYTINGNLKSINHFNLDNINDPGNDGYAGSTFPKDLFGMTFNYYDNDYISTSYNVNALNTFTAFNNSSFPATAYKTTYANGLPYAIAWKNPGSGSQANPAVYNYNFDVNYQLTDAKYGSLISNVYTVDGAGTNNESTIKYDLNGNIQSLTRNSSVLQYTYDVGVKDNRLNAVNLSSTSTNAYGYSANGQVTSITNNQYSTTGQFLTALTQFLTYNSSGLLNKFTTINNSYYQYAFSETGQRISKSFYTSAGVLNSTTFYVSDASGNLISTYTKVGAASPVQDEVHIYGTERIAVANLKTNTSPRDFYYNYEINDHLGNNRVRFYRDGSVVYKSDYYPYGLNFNQGGSNIPKRTYQSQFAQKDDESGLQHFKLRDYDPIIGRWTRTDPYNQYTNPYNGMGNNPITGVDPDGGFRTKAGAFLFNMAHGFKGNIHGSKGMYTVGFITYNGKLMHFSTANGSKFLEPNLLGNVIYAGMPGNLLDKIGSAYSKINFLGKGIVNPFILLGTGIGSGVINRTNIIFNEGFHEGAAYDRSLNIANTYEFDFDELQLVKKDYNLSNYISYENGGKELLFATYSVNMTFVPVLHPTTNVLINKVTNIAAKATLKKGVKTILDSFE